MRKIRYLLRWNNEGKFPTPLYHFYPKGKAEEKGYSLSEGLRRFPENRFTWERISE